MRGVKAKRYPASSCFSPSKRKLAIPLSITKESAWSIHFSIIKSVLYMKILRLVQVFQVPAFVKMQITNYVAWDSEPYRGGWVRKKAEQE
jgi:hypothetical protein